MKYSEDTLKILSLLEPLRPEYNQLWLNLKKLIK